MIFISASIYLFFIILYINFYKKSTIELKELIVAVLIISVAMVYYYAENFEIEILKPVDITKKILKYPATLFWGEEAVKD